MSLLQRFTPAFFPLLLSSDDEDPLAPMITWKDFQRLMPWEIVILVGGGYALAAGCKVGQEYLQPVECVVSLSCQPQITNASD